MAPTPTSVLSDGTIRRLVESGHLKIEPWDPSLLQPASVDLRLGRSFRVFHNYRAEAIDLRDPPTDLTEHLTVEGDRPFVIHPGEFVLGRTLERVEIPNDVVARIEGKALALDTEVPTPAGRRSMADLEPGDEVFDGDGRPTRIVAATQPLVDRPCREVTFSDGTRVTADVWHQWEVWTTSDRRRGGRPRVLTTAEIERTLRWRREYNHHVAAVPAVEHPQALAAAGCASRPTSGSPYGHWIGGTGRTRDAATQTREGRFERRRAIVDVRRVASVPVRCIEVASPRGVFLITRSYVPTHNSSLGRLGLIVHATAGFVDPGFRGTLTLEITNLTRVPIKLYADRPVAQLSFMALDRPAERPYGHEHLGSHYQGQVEATESRYGAGRTPPAPRR